MVGDNSSFKHRLERSKWRDRFWGLSQNDYPTRDDLVELNFRAIVATGRSILSPSPGVRTLGDACREPMQAGDTELPYTGSGRRG